MNSFNVYGQAEKKVGGNTPVWLGTVKPIPVGATVQGGVGKDAYYPAGTAVVYNPATKSVEILDNPSEASERANGYIYNDIYNDGEAADATVAVVMNHPEGLLVERVYDTITEDQIVALQAKIPGVLLVRD